jgi:hypothetical protein
MNITYFKELVKLGLKPLPIKWDENGKIASSHIIAHSTISESQWNETTLDQWIDLIDNANGIALKLFPPFGTIDFDTKNENGTVSFKDWFNIIEATNPDVLRKVCIESTRNKGYHVYIKYPKLNHKITLAANEDGKEVIAVYTGGLLSYCAPTPGYDMFHNSFEDLEELTDNEYDLLTSTGGLFNKYKEEINNTFYPIEYPQQYETTCLLFDKEITDEAFEELLNQIDLYEVRDFRYRQKQKFTAYLRRTSLANYSAKVYFSSRKVLLFTTSMPKFPCWADGKGNGDRSWVLTPSRIIYYKNDKDWKKTIDEIQAIADSIGIEINQQPIEQQPISKDRMQFPYDVFPQPIQDYIKSHRIQNEYIAGFMLSQLSTAIGNTCYLEALQGYKLRTNLYIAIVAHAGGGKSPAMGIGYGHLKKIDDENYRAYKARLAAYNEEVATMDKKDKHKPIKPILQQMVIDDATIETVINVLQHNPKGCCLVADELAGFIKRMSQYKDGDDAQKWLQMWSSETVFQQRVTVEERKIIDYTMGIVGGIQPGIMEILSKNENQYNGFYHRFLFVFPESEPKPSFDLISCPDYIKEQVDEILNKLLIFRENDIKDKYILSSDALALYKSWHDYKNFYYNRTQDENAKGIIAKYQAYCLRFALIIQCCDDLDKRTGIVDQSAVERAIRLTEYFLGNMLKSLKILSPETPLDNLKKPYDSIYKDLPDAFSTKTAIEIGSKYNIKTSTIKMWLQNNRQLFQKIEHGSYQKLL